MSQLRGFLKRFTGDNVSYDALTKQPITDAETKLKLFNDSTTVSIAGLDLYLKSMNKLIDQQLGEKFNECKELFAKYDKPNDQVMGTVFGRMSEIQKEISLDVTEMIRSIDIHVLKPLADYQKELITVKENKKELKEAYDKIEQCRQNLDKSKRDLENSQKSINQSHRMTMMREFESKRFNELTKLEEKLMKSEKELDEATSVANEKYDKYTESLYKRIAEECDLTNCYLKYLKEQRKYHKQALKKLDTLIPGVEETINNYHKKPVFGHPLEEYVQRNLRATNNGQPQSLVSPVIRKLIDGMCRQNVFSEEGIFRIAGSRIKMNCLLYAINSGYLEYLDTTNDFDVHCLAGVLKQYIRELPDSILCNHLYDEWIRAIKSPNKLEAFENVLEKLPRVNFENLRYLIKFLAKIVENSDQTKMTNSNMGICFGVSLLSSNNLLNSSNNSSSSNSLNTSQSDYNSSKTIDMATATNVFDSLLTNHENLFPGEINFLTTSLNTKQSILRIQTNNNGHNSKVNTNLTNNEQTQQAHPPSVAQRKIINNQINETESTNDISASIRNNLNVNFQSSPSISSNGSSSINNNITNVNRVLKNSSYDYTTSRQNEDDKYSSNNSINSISNKSYQSPINNDSSSTSPKQKSKKQAPAPPPSTKQPNDLTSNTVNHTNNFDLPILTTNLTLTANTMPSTPMPVINNVPNEDASNHFYPKLTPNINKVSTTGSNKGANEVPTLLPSLTTITTNAPGKFLEKPNHPPPSLPNRPPPIGFNICLNPADMPATDLPYPVTNNSSNFNNSASLLSSSSLSTNCSASTSCASSSSSSQEMLNSPINNNSSATNVKAPKPVVPRRPGSMIAAQINKFNRGEADFSDQQAPIEETQPSTTNTLKVSSEITSL